MTNSITKCSICLSGSSTSLNLNEKVVNPLELGNYTSHSLIQSRQKTKFCAKHQRKLAKAIKRSREFGIIKYL
jgi:ribosomal protein S18